MKNRYYVYELWCPLTNEIFYVGISDRYRTTGGYRPDDHITETLNYRDGKAHDGNIEKLNKILEILNNEKEIIIKEVFHTNISEKVGKKETELIQYYGRADLEKGTLLNKNDGGHGQPFKKGHRPWNAGLKYSYEDIHGLERADEIKKKQSETAKKNGTMPPNLKGREKSDEWKRKHSEYWSGKPKPTEQRRKISESLKGNVPWNKGTKGLVTQTPESNKKRSESLKAYWAGKKLNV